jgi:glycosyltransferase involved in cell wall biosynthesis
MKVLYISYPYFFDMDLSLIQSLSKKAEVVYMLELPVFALKTSALEITEQPAEAGIFNAKEYPELARFNHFLNLDQTYIVNRVSLKIRAASNLKLQKKILRFVRSVNPDIIHCNGFVGFDYFWFLLRNKYPIVQTIHDPFPHLGENSYLDFAVRKLNYSFISKKILLNTSQRDEFIARNKFKSKNIFNSSLGPYTHLSQLARENGRKPSNNILFFGRISPYKGIEYLIRAVKQLAMEIPDIKLTIAGQGNFWFDISEIRDSKNFEIINEFIPTQQLIQLLNEAEMVVCPYTDATQSGVIMTAFAFCKPVVATNVGGLAEMVDDGKTGRLVASRNVDQLAAAIGELLTDREKLERLSRNICAEYFEGGHSWDRIAGGLTGIYEAVIKK